MEIDYCHNEALNEKDDSSADEREIVETDNKHKKCENMGNNNEEKQEIKPKLKQGKKVKIETLEEESRIRKYANVDGYSKPQEHKVFPELIFTKLNRSKRYSSLDMNAKSNIITLYKMGRNITRISRELGISKKTVRTWVNRYIEGDTLEKKKRSDYKTTLTESQKQLIRTQMEKYGYVSTKNLADLFNSTPSTVLRCVNEIKKQNEVKLNKEEDRDAGSVDKDTFQCIKCDLRFEDKVGLEQHNRCENLERPCMWRCPHCTAEFKYNGSYRNHIRIVHKDKCNKSLYCEQCNRQFMSKYYYQRHLLMKHASEKDYLFKCDDCGRNYPDKKSLSKHMISEHYKYYTYKCNTCAEKFDSRKNLETHKNVQHSKKKHLCHLCGIQRMNPDTLAKHILEAHNSN